MESNASLERRGSLFFAPSMLDTVDHSVNKDIRSPSPDHAPKVFPVDKPKREVPSISISRHRHQSETQYADTEVSEEVLVFYRRKMLATGKFSLNLLFMCC